MACGDGGGPQKEIMVYVLFMVDGDICGMLVVNRRMDAPITANGPHDRWNAGGGRFRRACKRGRI